MAISRKTFPDLRTLDWTAISYSLLTSGWAHVPRLVQPSECRSLAKLYDQDRHFRSRIDMARYHFGQGEYSYFAYPLPAVVAHLRTHIYPHLVPIANRMMELMNRSQRYPATHAAFRKACQCQGQTKPTPLLLHYEAGGFNCLHRDIYGPTLFPLQVMVMLSQQGKEFEGGEFLLVENRPLQTLCQSNDGVDESVTTLSCYPCCLSKSMSMSRADETNSFTASLRSRRI